MNRPHVAALLREYADETEEIAAGLIPSKTRTPAGVWHLLMQAAKRLRVRAGEIEAGG